MQLATRNAKKLQHATRNTQHATRTGTTNTQRPTDGCGQVRACLHDAYERARVDFAAEADAVGKRRGDARAKENHLRVVVLFAALA